MPTKPTTAPEIRTTGAADNYLKFLIYGASGRGKTRCAASAALVKGIQPTLIIDCDESTVAVDWKSEQIRVRNYAELETALNVALSGKYKTVVLDGLTSLYRTILMPAAQEFNKKKYPSRDFDPDVPDRNDYQKAHGMFNKIMVLLRDAPVHFIATALEAYVVDSATENVVGYGPAIQGQLSISAMQYFTIVGRLVVNHDHEIELHCRPEYQVMTKDRRNLIPDTLELPDMKNAMAEIFGYYKVALKGG